jgi:hypothetical protein
MIAHRNRWLPGCIGLTTAMWLILPSLTKSASIQAEPADTEYRLAPDGATFIPSTAVLNYVDQPAVRNELGISNVQQAQIEKLRTSLEAANAAARAHSDWNDVDAAIERSDEARNLLGKILTPRQVRRHNQIVMQHLVIRFGLLQLMQSPDLAAVLEFDADQQQELQTILNGIGFGPTAPAPASRRLLPGVPPGGALPPAVANQPPRRRVANPPNARRPANAIRRSTRNVLDPYFTNPDLAPADSRIDPLPHDGANEQISDLLAMPQKRRLLEILGKPIAARPTGSPPAMLRPGTKEFAFPRVEVNDGWDRTFQVGRREIADGPAMPALLKEYTVREELSLDTGQVDRLPPVTGHPGDLSVIRDELKRALQPAQYVRLRELALQMVSRSCGKLALLEFRDVVDVLSLSNSQRSRLAELLRAESRSTRGSLIAAIERDSDRRREFDPAAEKHLDEILLPAQRQQLAESLGKPFRWELPNSALDRGVVPRLSLRGRLAPLPGYLTSIPQRFQSGWLIQRMLDLSPQQATAARDFSDSNLNPDDDRWIELLTPEQLRRYTELVLQACLGSDGPAAVFRFRAVTDALGLSQEQNRRLLEALWDDTRRYTSVPPAELAEKLPELDEQASKAIDSILTTEQRQSLTKFLGQPAEDRLANSQSGVRIENPTAPANPARGNRRLMYEARHRSARDLADRIRRQFLTDDRVRAVSSPEGNSVLLAAPSDIFDTVVAALPELDRPRQMVIVDVLIAEAPAARQGEPVAEVERPAADAALDGVPLLDKTELAGSIDKVTSKLKILVKERKITSWRSFRLQALEDEQAISHVEDAALVVGRADKFVPGFWSPILWPRQLGPRIEVIPSLTAQNLIKLDLSLRHTRQSTSDDTDELGISPDGPLIAQQMVTDRIDTGLEVKPGELVICGPIRTDAKSQTQLCVIVGAQINQSP